jgi:hypothetical protein
VFPEKLNSRNTADLMRIVLNEGRGPSIESGDPVAA